MFVIRIVKILKIRIINTTMDISKLNNFFDLQNSCVENIGYEFYNNQIVITLDCHQFERGERQEGKAKGHLINFIFQGAKEVEFSSQHFTLDNNKVIEVSYEYFDDDIPQMTIVFLAKEGIMELSFKATGVKCEPLNPYIDDRWWLD